jgi:predicted acetyltransferase
MTDVEIVHPMPADELEGWTETMAITFLDYSGRNDQSARRLDALRRDWLPDRFWGARDGRQWVGTLGAWPARLTVPGTDATLPADALTMVTVAATHRRRGLLTSMLTESLHAARDRGDAVSILWAAEWPIYGRFGYAPATISANYTLSTRASGGSLGAGGGTLRRVEPAELGPVAPGIFARAAAQRAGNIDRSQSWWNRTLGLDGYPENLFSDKPSINVLHEGADGPDGFLAWRPDNSFDIDGTSGGVSVVDLCAATESAYRELWSYLASMDLVGTVELHRRPIDEPVRWLLRDGRALRLDYAGDGIWLRLLDVPAALSGRRYAVSDRLVFEIVDDDIGGFAAGRYVLEGGPDSAKCMPSTVDNPELRVHQRALAAAYLGGYSLHGQAIAGRIDELSAGALRRADAMFATPTAPWCATGF